MRLDYRTPDKVVIDMKDYCNQLIEDYPYETKNNVNCPWNVDLFNHEKDQVKLNDKASENFHTEEDFAQRGQLPRFRTKPPLFPAFLHESEQLGKDSWCDSALAA